MAEGPPGGQAAERAGRSREEEGRRARRDAPARLGDRAFAISLRDALDVHEPVTSAFLRDRFGELPPDRREDGSFTVAGRVVLKRDMGKLKFLTLRDQDGDIQLVFDGTAVEE